MSCPEVRLEEYADGELSAAERAAVEAHLQGCADCRREREDLGRLEALLRAAPAGAAPDVERFVRDIGARSRRARGGWVLAAAAALLLGIFTAVFSAHKGEIDVRAELVRFAHAPSPQAEGRIRAAGKAGLAVLEASLGDKDVRIQFAAASLLFKLADDATRGRVLARFQPKVEAEGSWTLSEIGADDEDAEEMAPVAVSMALEGQERWAIEILRKLNRLSLRNQAQIIDSVVTLLRSTNPRVQKLALDIVRELDIEFPLSAIVDLLDSPELGDAALKFLRDTTRKDFGKDKEAWRRAIGSKEEGA